MIDLDEMDPRHASASHPVGEATTTGPDPLTGREVPPDLAPEATPLVLTALAQAASTLMPWRRLGWAAAATAVILGVGSAVLVRRWAK